MLYTKNCANLFGCAEAAGRSLSQPYQECISSEVIDIFTSIVFTLVPGDVLVLSKCYRRRVSLYQHCNFSYRTLKPIFV